MKKFRSACIAIVFLFPMVLSGQEDWWRLFFTHPGRTSGTSAVTPERALVTVIRSARNSFYGAFFDLDSVPVGSALMEARKRGVDVRLVTDDSNYSNEMINSLMGSGIPVVSDNRRPLMHNKFAVVDGELLWTGSWNATKNCEAKNNNNAILIRSADLAAIYKQEFDEMFELRVFGYRKEPGVFGALKKNYHVRIEDADINAYFSPDDDVERIIIKRIKKAKKSIRFMAFSFTSDGIGEAMIEKSRQGVSVSGVFEKRGAKSREGEYTKMRLEGLPVRLDANGGAMHHKVIIIDEERVITGSYNFSKNASRRNDENVLMIDSKDIAAQYLKEFDRIYRESRDR